MVNILIVDDEQTKRCEIYRVLSPYISDEKNISYMIE